MGESFCQLNSDNQLKLATVVDEELQKQLAAWSKSEKHNQERINQAAHKMSTDFIQWLVQEANAGNWDGEKLGEAFCQLDSDNKLKLVSVVDGDLQKQLAGMNKEKTCLSVPLLGSNLQEWMYQEAEESRWDNDLVFRVLERKEIEGSAVVSARVKHLGMYQTLCYQNSNDITP